jgi:hypothetical protein
MKESFITRMDHESGIIEIAFKYSVNPQPAEGLRRKQLDWKKVCGQLRDSLLVRIKHCRKVLVTEILEAEDVAIQGEYAIYANSIGKHFSIKTYENMGNLMNKISNLKDDSNLPEMLKTLHVGALTQMVKAVSQNDKLSAEDKEDLMDLLCEFIDTLDPR